MEILIDKQNATISELISLSNQGIELTDDHSQNAPVLFLDLKSLNREIFTTLEKKRKHIESEKEKIEKLLLFYENLKYKQSYLHKQIRICKDLYTPNLNTIQNEMNTKLGTNTYTNQETLTEINQNSVNLLENEITLRQNMQITLNELEVKYNKSVEKLDKKRKFIDELPTRVSIIKSSTVDLHTQFINAVAPISAVDELR